MIHTLTKNSLNDSMITYRNYMVFEEIYPKILELEKDKMPPINPIIGNKELKIPTIKMSDSGLLYEAYFVPYDNYVSDSGGTFWYNSMCPLEAAKQSIAGDTIQYLFHPIWWKYNLA